MRQLRHQEEIATEMKMIMDAIEEEREVEASQGGQWSDLWGEKEMMRYRTMLGFMIQLLQQVTGINAVMCEY